MKTIMNTIKRIVIVMLTLVITLGTAVPTFAASKEVPVTKMNMKSRITIKVGETKTINVTSTPSKTTYKTKINWSSNTMGSFSLKVNGKGSYYGQSSSVTIKGTEEGTGFITAWVYLYDSKKRYKGEHPVGTIITVVPNKTTKTKGAAKQSNKKVTKTATTSKSKTTASNTNRSKKTTQTTTAKQIKVSDAYTVFNKFRTTRSNQWYWNANNKTKTYTYGLKSLKRDKQLETIAKLRAKEQWASYFVKGKPTHTRPNGKDCRTAYPASAKYYGENLAWGHTSSKQVINAWAEAKEKYADQAHRRNMLAKYATRVGIACYEKNGKRCWAMCLGY